jgi:hypothetical protein
VLEARAQERQAAEQAEYEAKLRRRAEKARRSGRKPGGRLPIPPSDEPQDKDQYDFTDPESPTMKCSNSTGFEQAYNARVAVDQDSLFIVACSLSNHPNDKAEAEPTPEILPPDLGTPAAAALDNGFWREWTGAESRWRGRVEHVQSGQRADFLYLDDMLRFLRQMGVTLGQLTDDDEHKPSDS